MNSKVLLLLLLLLFATLAGAAAPPAAPVVGHPPPERTPAVLDARALGLPPVSLDPTRDGNPASPYATLRKSGPSFAPPGQEVLYTIEVANYEAEPLTVNLAETLPAGLTLLPQSASGGLAAAGDGVSWSGTLPPGHLDYLADETASVPYLDLADYGVTDLCAPLRAAGAPCRDVAVTFNLGLGGSTAALYGRLLHSVTVTSNGLLTAGAAPAGPPAWLPDPALAGPLAAGFWRQNDLTAAGRWHAAVIRHWIAGRDVFYVQWHDAPRAENPDATARHAVALLLDGPGEIFFLTANVADPAAEIAGGYAVGLMGPTGARGTTWAYAGPDHPPQGHPPAAGTTLRFAPTLFGAGNGYRRVFTYRARVAAPVPALLPSTVAATTDAADPALAAVWSTHYLHVRHQLFLPWTGHGGTP